MSDNTVRLSLQLWDANRRVRMSLHRDVHLKSVQKQAGKMVGEMLPAFWGPNGPEEASASVSTQQGKLMLRRPRSRRRR